MRVLALGLISEGFGFTVFEGEERLVDWGLRRVDRAEDRNRASLERLEGLLEEWRPDAVVLEDCDAPSARRRERIRHLAEQVEDLAGSRGCEVSFLPTRGVKRLFEADNKYELALAVAALYPEMEPRLPPERKMWVGPDERQGIFDAAGLALAYYRGMTPGRKAA